MDTTERRSYKRFTAYLRVEEVEALGLAFSQTGITADVSRRGMSLLIHDCGLPQGLAVSFKVRVPRYNQTVGVKGIISWFRKEGRNILMGLRIDSMPSQGLCSILDWAYNSWLLDRLAVSSAPVQQKAGPGVLSAN